MVNRSRRDAFKAMLLGATAASLPMKASAAVACSQDIGRAPRWQTGIEGQRRADLGNGTY